MRKIIASVKSYFVTINDTINTYKHQIRNKKTNHIPSDHDTLIRCQILLEVMKENEPFWI